MSLPALEFEPITHTYTIGARTIPSVTQILEDVGIIDYSHIPWSTRQMALERGRLVHEAIALDLEDDLDEDSLHEAGLMGYVEAAREARRVLGIDRPLAHEERLYHPTLDYAGTLDLRSDKLILDWKTTQAEYWVRFQLAAYAAALAARDAVNPSTHWRAALIRRVCVELHEDATYRIYEVPIGDWHRDFEVFIAALRIWREKTEPRRLS